MSVNKRFRAPLIAVSGMIMALATFAGPAQAAEGVYPPPEGTDVLGASATADVPAVAGVTATAGTAGTAGLAFTGTNAIGIGGLGGLLLVGGGLLVVAGRRRKTNA